MATTMSRSSNSPWIVGLFWMLTLASLMVKSVSSVTCQEAISTMAPCSGYLKGKDPPPPADACCLSCRNLQQQCHTKEERKALCECLKETGRKVGVDLERVKKLPVLCKLQWSIPIPITPEIDCSKISG